MLSRVPFLAPISYILIRTLITSVFLFIVGYIREGRVVFPPIFRDSRPVPKELSAMAMEGQSKPPSSSPEDTASMNSRSSIGPSLSKSLSARSLNKIFCGLKGGDQQPSLSLTKKSGHHHRPRRKKRRAPTFRSFIFTATQSILSVVRFYREQINNLNPEVIQIICAGLSGMLLLPVCYTTGLLLTSPTVASVWDGPIIPLGCFCAAVGLGLEERSKFHPVGQIGSLLLCVVGSIVVVVVDYSAGGHGIKSEGMAKDVESDLNWVNEHIRFIEGNIIFVGLVAAYSATALLQRRLNNYPPIHLTGWMFGIAFVGCFLLLLAESILGSRIVGCSLGQALLQIYMALRTSPTFRYGLLYSAVFVGGVCFSIGSYASSHLESSVITLFAAAQPPITAVLELIWEGKSLGWKKTAGMGCVGAGMCMFTYIKSLEKGDKLVGDCQQDKKVLQNYVHSMKSQSTETDQVLVDFSNGKGSLNKERSANLTNRKVQAEV